MMSTQKNLYAVILVGGSGTRFWPLSRKKTPKQFLNITGNRSLLQETLARIRPLIKGSRVLIVTGAMYKREVEQQTKAYGVPKSNIFLEPEGKNTAPAIYWAATHLYNKNKNAIMAVLPSDHLILHPKAFLKQLRKAVQPARADCLVTLGIVPDRPETGYGYLKGERNKRSANGVLKVQRFVEKPNLAKAKKFIKDKRYFWNSGMFVWKCSVILDEFEKYLPKFSRLFKAKSSPAYVRKIWPKLPSISIDYGIMERSKKVVTVPAKDIGWSDLGSWESFLKVFKKDKRGNIFKGDVIDVGSQNSLVLSQSRLIATIGLDNIIVIETPDAILVARSDHSQKVREVVDALNKKKRPEAISH